MATIDVSISVVHYRDFNLTRKCLDSVFSKTKGISFQVIVVDNHSPDTENLRRRYGKKIKLIVNAINKGFAAANNQALKIVVGRYFLMLNPDTFLTYNAIGIMVKLMDRHSDWGVCCPQLLNLAGSRQKSYSDFKTPFQRAMWEISSPATKLGLMKDNVRKKESFPKNVTEVHRPRGTCYLIKRECIEQIGPLDEKFYMYGEEVDWSMRAKSYGWKNMFVPSAKVFHIGGASTTQPIYRQVQQYSEYYYYDKHYRGYASWLIRLFAVFGLFLWLVVAVKYRQTKLLSNAQISLINALASSWLIDWKSLKHGN